MFMIVAISILTVACKSKIQQQDSILLKKENIGTSTIMNSDTVDWFVFNDELGMYTAPKQSYILYQDEDYNYKYENLLKKRKRKDVIIDSTGIQSGTYVISEEEVEKFEIKYNSNNQPLEIRRFKSPYSHPISLKSIEKYKYINNLLVRFEFKDFLRITPKLDSISILMTHEYDKEKRLLQTLISKKINGSEFFTVDTVNYFYHKSETIPHLIKKTEFKGTEFFISQKNNIEVEIVKIQKADYKDSISVIRTTSNYKFDKRKRVVEYTKKTDIDIPIDLKEIRFEKYVYDYSERSDSKRIPMLLYDLGGKNIIPNPDIYWYFTSNVEIDQYPDINLRTDLSFFDLPDKIEIFKSLNGEEWIPISKYVKRKENM